MTNSSSDRSPGITTQALVTLQFTVTIEDLWEDGCTLGQVLRSARQSAENRVRNTVADNPALQALMLNMKIKQIDVSLSERK